MITNEVKRETFLNVVEIIYREIGTVRIISYPSESCALFHWETEHEDCVFGKHSWQNCRNNNFYTFTYEETDYELDKEGKKIFSP